MLKFILTVILIILVLRSLAKLLMPFMVARVVRKAEESMQGRYNRQYNQQARPAGQIEVDYMPPPSKPKKKPVISDREGDFVDFEEVK
jgi:uncharacterized membrane protein